ncbi:amino acid transporter [Georgenia sp. 311]|uniref:Amino acid transporter n=1 Tax=Georgenia wutianyii TaxID=2585135 RepID=A0ABX5VST3_9MICO|nr:amino acid transporter [Georgenia wutianyii]TNC19815.1 amino acid transporter [Georgenia sp. 311]
MPNRLPSPVRRPAPRNAVVGWLLRHEVSPAGPQTPSPAQRTHAWWKVMCLTGLDYFSTLAYLPGIAALTAGALSPLATLVIVGLTLFGVLPMYRQVARESPHGQGSIAMLEHLLPFWRGKFFVLALLGFVVTSWIVTITLSAADATVHVLESPLAPDVLEGHAVAVTVVLLVVLVGVFLLGFTEAISLAIPVVGLFLVLNVVVIGASAVELADRQGVTSSWWQLVTTTPLTTGISDVVLAFPLLILGLSGFETGVSMMPLVDGGDRRGVRGRVHNTQTLLTTAALIMSAYLLATSLVTTLLIPPEEFAPGGEANGRALAYLAHGLLGEGFGTLYDISTILILWFAGASAMAGLINIVPRYLPAYGMVPEWGRAVRPVVLVYGALAVVLTVIFRADVDTQAGAYATGILAMMASAAVAVTISARRRRRRRATAGFGLLSLALGYALVDNIVLHPDGIAIAAVFVGVIVVTSLVSRAARTIELRVGTITLDDAARRYIADALRHDGTLYVVAKKPLRGGQQRYVDKESEQHWLNPLPSGAHELFLEVVVDDPSRFSEDLRVHGVQVSGYRVLQVHSPAVPNAIAGILLALAAATGTRPHCYFAWSEGSPVHHLLRFLFLGQGDTPIMVREILRRVEPDPRRRPTIHVGGG